MSKIFGERLKELRTNAGLFQKDLAQEFDVIKQTYSSWETGVSEPNSEKLIQIADYFSVTVDYLVGRDRDN